MMLVILWSVFFFLLMFIGLWFAGLIWVPIQLAIMTFLLILRFI
jgi:hypothetical protein